MLTTLPFTLTDLRTAYSNGLRPEDVIDEVFSRLEKINDPNIFIELCDIDALKQAAQDLGDYDPEKPLWGIPYAVKDNIDVLGNTTTAACPAYAYAPKKDSFVVAQLRDAGALMIGKTNLDQFATGLVGVRTPYGAPLNSIDPEIVPGGSSGGSGVVVGHGAVTFSLGTDTAGSGRVPAALNNIVGLKPTLGTLSATGVVPACRTLDTISIFAMTVDDAHAVFRVAQGYDPADAYSRRFADRPLTAAPKGLKIGIPDAGSIRFFGDQAQEEKFAEDVAALAAQGAIIQPIDFNPLYDIAEMLYQGAWVAERHSVIEDMMSNAPDDILPVTRKIIGLAEGMSATDAFRGIYRLAELKRVVEPILDQLDLLCVPTIPTFYTVADLEADPVTPNSNFGTYTNFVNLLDMCGIAVPTGPRSDGRPGSVTFLAEAGRDDLVASVARQFEFETPRNLGATKFPLMAPPAIPASESDEIELAVCGAHMAGLPLNEQLTERGGRFLRTAETAPTYEFFALGDVDPVRPGLVRSTHKQANPIALEIWSLPKSEFGNFISQIPAPLAIGSVELSDGNWVKGFLCEASATTNAANISEIGNWRTYIGCSD